MAVMRESVTFDALNNILRRFETTERLLKDDDRLTAKGAEYLTQLMDIVRGNIKTRMFYVLMDFMREQGKLTPVMNGDPDIPGAAESESVCERE